MKTNKFIFKNHQSPGDILMLLHAITSLHSTFPNKYITDVRVSCLDIFYKNPLITQLNENDEDVLFIHAQYPTIHQSNTHSVKFLGAFNQNLEEQLEIKIKPSVDKGFLHILDEEKDWLPEDFTNKYGKEKQYWILNAGHKQDFTAKTWAFSRYQEVVNNFSDIIFIQVGLKHHMHPELHGSNLLNMVGKTNTRELIKLVYNSSGIITPVSFPMHLAYAVPCNPKFGRLNRPCVVIAGGREPVVWEHGPNHQFLHTCGMLRCCNRGGCWKSRVVALNDGSKQDEKLCEMPVLVNNQWIPKCMEMISVEEVCTTIKKYLNF